MTSDRAFAPINSIGVSAALQVGGVVAVITAKDIVAPGVNTVGGASSGGADDPVFADDEVTFWGQPIALVVAETRAAAEAAVALVAVSYGEPSRPPVLTMNDAASASSPYADKATDHMVSSGKDLQEALRDAQHVVAGTVESHSMVHFYM